MTETALLERVVRAMDEADRGHSIRLTDLADGVSTYTLDLQDGSEILTFPSHEGAYEHATQYRAMARARAAMAVMDCERELSEFDALRAALIQARSDLHLIVQSSSQPVWALAKEARDRVQNSLSALSKPDRAGSRG